MSKKVPLSREILIQVFLNGNFQFQKAFDAGPITVGRQPEADLILDQPYISRNHFRIEEIQDSVFRITHLNSRNGILIEGQFVDQAMVTDQMKVNIEGIDLQIMLGKVMPRKKSQELDEETQPPRTLASIHGKKGR